jgi:pimeloyl-ACP methyl ester carboxylesterase
VSALRAPLSQREAETVLGLLGKDRLARLAVERKGEIEAALLRMNGKSLRWIEKAFGEEPPGGRSLWISLHGGGAAPQAVNDQQWVNQAGLYALEEGIYVAPRAPTDTWNLWHESHIDPMFGRLIEDYVCVRGVNPDKVYLMGYSAGGDGVWQLAPRMADRFAAAAMMAGHPNDARLDGLRNLPFAILMGGNDGAYERNKMAEERIGQLEELRKQDPAGYRSFGRIYAGLGHWMEHRDREAIPWMAEHKRNPWPKRIVWVQDDVLHSRFYWLQLPNKDIARAGQRIEATVDGQAIRLTGDIPQGLRLGLRDELIDLDQPVTVSVNGRTVFNSVVPRTAKCIAEALAERFDRSATPTASWEYR